MRCGPSSVLHSASVARAIIELSVLVELVTGSYSAEAIGLPRSNHDVYCWLFVVSNLIYDADLFELQSDVASYLHSLPTTWTTVYSLMESDVK